MKPRILVTFEITPSEGTTLGELNNIGGLAEKAFLGACAPLGSVRVLRTRGRINARKRNVRVAP